MIIPEMRGWKSGSISAGSLGFGLGSLATLVGSSWLVEGEGGLIATALFEPIRTRSAVAVVFALKATLH